MKKAEADRISALYDRLNERNRAIAYAYASGLLTSQAIKSAERIAKDVADRM